MNKKESRTIYQSGSGGDQPMLLKRSSTRSYTTRNNEQQKQGNPGRPNITDAFWAGESPELAEMPVRGASFFMGQTQGKGNGMALQRNPSRMSTKLEKNLSGIFMKNQQHNEMCCGDDFGGAPQLTHLQSIPQFNRGISDVPPIKRNSSKKYGDNDTIGKLIGQNNQNQLMPLTRNNSKLAGALNQTSRNNMLLNNVGNAGMFGGLNQDAGTLQYGGSFYDISNPTWDNHVNTNSAFAQFQPQTAGKNQFQDYFEKFERKKSMGADSLGPVNNMQTMQEKTAAVTTTGKSTLLGKRTTRQQSTTTKKTTVPSQPPIRQQNLLTVPKPQRAGSSGPKRGGKQKAGSSSNSDRVSASSCAGSQKVKNQRGRKREKWEIYVQEAKSKIDEYKGKLKTAKAEKVDVKLRQKWRNIVSAQQSRLKKKFEVIYLHNLLRNKDDSLEQIMDICLKNLKQNPDIMEKIRQDVAKIELPDPHPEEDCDGHDEETLPTCMQKLPNGKFKTTNDKVSDFRQTFKYKFITPEDELNRYKHNDEKDEDDYKESNKKKSKKGE